MLNAALYGEAKVLTVKFFPFLYYSDQEDTLDLCSYFFTKRKTTLPSHINFLSTVKFFLIKSFQDCQMDDTKFFY